MINLKEEIAYYIDNKSINWEVLKEKIKNIQDIREKHGDKVKDVNLSQITGIQYFASQLAETHSVIQFNFIDKTDNKEKNLYLVKSNYNKETEEVYCERVAVSKNRGVLLEDINTPGENISFLGIELKEGDKIDLGSLENINKKD